MLITTYEAIARLVISIALGTLIGLERKRTSKGFVDTKLFSFSTIFGCIAALSILFEIRFSEFFPLVAFLLIIGITYDRIKETTDKAKKEKGKKGNAIREEKLINTYLLPIMFLIGVIAGSGLVWEAAAGTFLIIGIIAIGRRLERTVEILTEEEISELIQIGVILFILFPILPQKPIEIYGISIDLFLIFAFFLIVTLLNLFVLIAYRIFRGETSTITGFIGGIINSTYAIYQLNKTKKGINTSGVMGAMLGSIVRNTVLVLIVMNEMIYDIVPMFGLIGGMLLLLVLRERFQKNHKNYSIEKPITMINSIYATVFLASVLIIFQISAKSFPQYLPILSFLASLLSSGYTILSLGSVYMTITRSELILSIASAIIGSLVTTTITSYALKKEIGKSAFKYSLISAFILLAYLLIIHVL